MKKFISIILCFALIAGTFSACSSASAEENGERDAPVRFEDIEYVRPDIDEIQKAADAVSEALEEEVKRSEQRKKLAEVEDLLDDFFALYYTFNTMDSYAYIRTSIDCTDSYFAAEYDFCEENEAVVSGILEDVYYDCALSYLGSKLEKDYFWEGFCEEYADESEALYTDEYIELSQQESALLSKHRELIASPTITIGGKEYDYNSYLEEALANENYSDYYSGLYTYYEQYMPRFAEVYIELIKVRRAMAETAGYDSYEQLCYEEEYSRDYTPEQGRELIDAVEYCIPAVYEMYYDSDAYSSANVSSMDDAELLKTAEEIAAEVGGSVKEAFDYMTEYGYYDAAFSHNKAAGSFETYLVDYESPFLFVNPEGDTTDISTFFHELGHFTDDYVNYGSFDENLDVAEIYSNALENMITLHLGSILPRREVKALKARNAGNLLGCFAEQSAFSRFEQIAYSTPVEELSMEFLADLSLKVAKDFGFASPGLEWYYKAVWTDINHYFIAPFYMISYVVDNDIAIQFYEMEAEKKGSGLEKLEDMLDRGECEGLMDLLEEKGLESPFSRERIEKDAEIIRSMFK